jgi:site-specific recombinase XerD
MKSTFNILFYLKKSSVKKTGYAPLMVRITINGVSAPFSLKAEAKPDDWDTKGGRLRGRTKDASDLNAYIDNVRSKIRRHYRELCDRESVVSAEMVRDAFLGVNTHRDTLLCLFDRYNENLKTIVGKQIKGCTYYGYTLTRKRLYQFLKKTKNMEDISLKDISPQFVADFERFLFVDCEYMRNTAMNSMKHFKRVVVMAHNNGWISINPFASYKFQFDAPDRGYLSEKELTCLMQHPVQSSRMEKIRDVFVFCCFTGLSYIDVKGLREENIQRSFDGHLWVIFKRHKTNVQSNIRLLSIPQSILEKYKGKCKRGMLLPVPTNYTGNNRLRELGKQCGIATKVTFHLARHTFATTVTLGKGVPIESVSKMLGHTNVSTTQIYARIVDSKVSSDMEVLSQKLGNLENVYQQTQVG